MIEKDVQRVVPEKPRRRVQDLPGCIKYILLLLLILLLLGEIASGEFSRISFGEFGRITETGWLTWLILFILLIKLILIIGLIVLIWVQRAPTCQLTEPTGCTEEEPDPAAWRLFVRVRGTASGAGFGSYTLEVRKVGFPDPFLNVVSYPGGGASGVTPVINGELGQIDTISLTDDAYEITLTVYPTWGGAPKTCTITFNLLKAIVYINRVAGVPTISMSPVPDTPNPFDPAAELRKGSGLVAVGGSIAISGAAYVYECQTRKIKKYEIRHAKVTAPGLEPSQPAIGDPIPPDWPAGSSNRVVLLEYLIPAHYQPWTRVGIAPIDLINSWKTVPPPFHYKLQPGRWNSEAAGSGRYSLLLTAEDTTGMLYHDIQHIWLDNKSIIGDIVKFQWFNPETGKWEDLPACQDVSMKKHKKLRIMGLAWDPLIDEGWWTPPAAPTAPNDNFGHYWLEYKKQFQTYLPLTGNVPTRVPALPAAKPVPTPTVADAGELAVWDLTTLDAGPRPSPGAIAPDGMLYRNEFCTYTLKLYVTDTTVVPGPGTHHTWDEESVKIINDL